MNKLPIVAVEALKPKHLARHPVWGLCDFRPSANPESSPPAEHYHGVEIDGEAVHPLEEPLPFSQTTEVLIVRARFTLADGEELWGALVLHKQRGRPAHAAEPLIRWHDAFFALSLRASDAAKLDERRREFYGALHKQAAQVFPLRFAVEAGLLTESVTGELRGFRVGLYGAPYEREIP